MLFRSLLTRLLIVLIGLTGLTAIGWAMLSRFAIITAVLILGALLLIRSSLLIGSIIILIVFHTLRFNNKEYALTGVGKANPKPPDPHAPGPLTGRPAIVAINEHFEEIEQFFPRRFRIPTLLDHGMIFLAIYSK